MPAQPCANHPNEQTFVRCGRCDKPICVRCMVDTPVGKKCRPCAQNRTHLEESTGGQVAVAFLAGTAVALPAGCILQQFPTILILAAPYGWLVAEVARRAGQRSRSLAMQAAAGAAALIGALLGASLQFPLGMPEGAGVAFHWPGIFQPFSLFATALGVAVAVSCVRYL
jgi:hypothetical protein